MYCKALLLTCGFCLILINLINQRSIIFAGYGKRNEQVPGDYFAL
jgi:hypothetical protein